MKASLVFAVTLALLVVLAPVTFAQGRPKSPARITHLMSAEQAGVTGLQTLSSAQIDALSTWLEDYRCAVMRLAVAQAEGEDRDVAIESRISGDFDGWVGDTVFRLQNGQIWQQTSASAKYHFAQSPRVTISPAPHRMHVEGLDVEIMVRRLR